MAEFPAMPLWTDAYLADCGHLTDAEHGIYLQLMMLAWRTPGCRIPNDDTWLARKMRRSVEDVESDVRPILNEFWSTNGNHLFQRRQKSEWDYLQKRRKKQSDRAKSRWNKEKGVRPGSTASGNALSTPTPTLSKKESPTGIRKKNAARPLPPDFSLDEKMKLYAASKGYRNGQIEAMFENFRNHHEAKASKFASWPAAWRTWVGNQLKYDERDGKAPSQQAPRIVNDPALDEFMVPGDVGRVTEGD